MSYRITTSGQVSIPADVRRRWGTRRVRIEDRGDHVIVTPLPDDPIEAAFGAFAGRGIDTAALRRRAREDDRRAENRRRR